MYFGVIHFNILNLLLADIIDIIAVRIRLNFFAPKNRTLKCPEAHLKKRETALFTFWIGGNQRVFQTRLLYKSRTRINATVSCFMFTHFHKYPSLLHHALLNWLAIPCWGCWDENVMQIFGRRPGLITNIPNKCVQFQGSLSCIWVHNIH